MKWIKRLVVAVVVLAAIVVAVGLMLPSTVHVERSTVIAAPATAVFPYVNNYRLFNSWSPWAKKDPDTRYTFSGPESGVGAKLGWESKTLGNGSQAIVESETDRRVKVALDFGGMGKATATYTLSAEANGTKVTWAFDEDFGNNLLARYFGLLFERFIGEDYEQGLANLKTMVEGAKQ
jgi:ribosome-associated toxin RatA of RatAB toxin-antitoxin module